jgi:hypothetical protein
MHPPQVLHRSKQASNFLVALQQRTKPVFQSHFHQLSGANFVNDKDHMQKFFPPIKKRIVERDLNFGL